MRHGSVMVVGAVVRLAIVQTLWSVSEFGSESWDRLLHHVTKAGIVVGTVVCHETDWFIMTI